VFSIGQVEDGHILMLTMGEALVLGGSIERGYWGNGVSSMLMIVAAVQESWWRVGK
jgi:hypothetical protein